MDLSESGKEHVRELLQEYNIADTDIIERFEFRNIRLEEIERAIEIEKIGFPQMSIHSGISFTDAGLYEPNYRIR